ncbi:hypothetical protein [Methanococcus maripaludis]|uniref:Uncharacterized protein n=1 Tax=Methanococcus maripaludis TaxID=39152 RepID=A0A7J9PDS7_METMI|nr:hypothetical protein [Methanococcus maripaludis]MBA2860944.1 hypothetical protein [Methanococcus maripaludis]
MPEGTDQEFEKIREIYKISKNEYDRELEHFKLLEEKCEKHIFVYTIISAAVTLLLCSCDIFVIRFALGLSLFYTLVALFISFLGLKFEEMSILEIDIETLGKWDILEHKELLIDLTSRYVLDMEINRNLNNTKAVMIHDGHIAGQIAFISIAISCFLSFIILITTTSGQ